MFHYHLRRRKGEGFGEIMFKSISIITMCYPRIFDKLASYVNVVEACPVKYAMRNGFHIFLCRSVIVVIEGNTWIRISKPTLYSRKEWWKLLRRSWTREATELSLRKVSNMNSFVGDSGIGSIVINLGLR